MLRNIPDFKSCQRGSILPAFGLIAIVILGLLGATIDYERVTRIKGRVMAAADSASLAAAKKAAELSSQDPTRPAAEIIAQAQDFGLNFFLSNMSEDELAAVKSPAVEVRQDNGVWVASAKFDGELKTLLAGVAGIGKFDIKGTVESSVAPGFPVLDIAMCVDSTGSMTSTLDAVKNNALNFYDNLNAELKAKGINPFPLVRVRMIYYKEFGDITPGVWDADPLVASSFFSLPDQSADFKAFVSPQMAGGGGDWAEGGNECLNEAISSAWLEKGDTVTGYSNPVTDVYPLIVVWTDASAHPIAYPNALANPAYPPASHMPRADAAFLAKWNKNNVIDQANKQILFFGDPAQDAGDGETGWHPVMKWPKFSHGGTVTEANTSMIEFLANGIATNMRSLSVTQ